MCEKYDVTYDGDKIGWLVLKKQGLYYSVHCRCRVKDDKMYALWSSNAETTYKLGVVVPIGSEFGLDVQIPAKRIPLPTSFSVRQHLQSSAEMFIPIRNNCDFPYLSQIHCGRFTIVDGRAGILLPDKK